MKILLLMLGVLASQMSFSDYYSDCNDEYKVAERLRFSTNIDVDALFDEPIYKLGEGYKDGTKISYKGISLVIPYAGHDEIHVDESAVEFYEATYGSVFIVQEEAVSYKNVAEEFLQLGDVYPNPFPDKEKVYLEELVIAGFETRLQDVDCSQDKLITGRNWSYIFAKARYGGLGWTSHRIFGYEIAHVHVRNDGGHITLSIKEGDDMLIISFFRIKKFKVLKEWLGI